MPAERVHAAATRIDEEQLLDQHARRLNAVVGRSVRTSPANLDDACRFASLQLVRHQPPRAVAVASLCTTAVREAMKLRRPMAGAVGLDQLGEIAADPVLGARGRL